MSVFILLLFFWNGDEPLAHVCVCRAHPLSWTQPWKSLTPRMRFIARRCSEKRKKSMWISEQITVFSCYRPQSQINSVLGETECVKFFCFFSRLDSSHVSKEPYAAKIRSCQCFPTLACLLSLYRCVAVKCCVNFKQTFGGWKNVLKNKQNCFDEVTWKQTLGSLILTGCSAEIWDDFTPQALWLILQPQAPRLNFKQIASHISCW